MGVTVSVDGQRADRRDALAHDALDRGTDLAPHQRQRLVIGDSPLIQRGSVADSPLLAYPEFPKSMTPKRLAHLVRPTPDELRWVQERCKSPPARLGLLCLLKCFPVLGRLATPAEIPAAVVEYLARRAGLDRLTLADYPRRTRVRHHIEVRAYLGIEPWCQLLKFLSIRTKVMSIPVCGQLIRGERLSATRVMHPRMAGQGQ